MDDLSQKIIDLLKSGTKSNHQVAFSLIYANYFTKLTRWTKFWFVARKDREDAFQEALLKFYEFLLEKRFVLEKDEFQGLLRKMYHNQLVNAQAKKGRQEEHEDHFGEQAEEFTEDAASLDDSLLEEFQRQTSDLCAQIMRLRFWSKCTWQEIAEILDLETASKSSRKYYTCIGQYRKSLGGNT